MENRKIRALGYIVSDGKYCQMKTKKGDLHSISQDEEIKKLADTNILCVFQKLNTLKAGEDFWALEEIIGKSGDPATEITGIAKAHGWLQATPYAVKKQIELLPDSVDENDIVGYSDLRHIPFVTIDPDTAKDFDDAVWAKKNKDGSYTMKVAIANVAHYIKPETPAFDHACAKGNSAYFMWLVDHMFMPKLSNGICSLNEGVDRLTLCTTATIDQSGNVKEFMIEPAVIRSRHRLTYKEADFLYFGENTAGDDIDHTSKVAECKDIMQSLEDLYDVSYLMYKERMHRGSLDIDTPELEFEMDDEKKKVLRYYIAHNEYFTSVIEETAVRANEIFGDIGLRLDIPLCFRDHSTIEEDKIPAINGRLAQFGLSLPKSPKSKDIQKIFNSVKGKKIEEYVVHMLLKAMDRAFYSSQNEGHAGVAVSPHRFVQFEIEELKKNKGKEKPTFQEKIDNAKENYYLKTGRMNGLAFDGDITHGAYCHSTSPIRRGADLINQNQMLSLIMNNKLLFNKHKIENYCENLNYGEYSAQLAEMDCCDYLLAVYAMANIGKIYENCHVISIGEKSATIMCDDGFKMSVSYSDLGIRKKHLKIGQTIDKVAISTVSLNPARIMGERVLTKTKTSSDITENIEENEIDINN